MTTSTEQYNGRAEVVLRDPLADTGRPLEIAFKGQTQSRIEATVTAAWQDSRVLS
ncbi:hypothetical protein [Streptomyces sp. MH60]|uniref:hypothetical protein n=1 Tax=Streptomyces sp. MH60 TaxID=1940758 RepID=UPI0013002784|nr:hypothetical protein [Streptomyces sp. MH60]